MSRYRGPRVRAMRALGVQLPGLSSKSHERRPYPPGQHGQARRKVSEFGLRLLEKQKLCRNYGVSERQLRRLMIEARSADGPTGERLLELLERRLDNVVLDRKSTRLNSSHSQISYAVFCLKKKKNTT